MQITNVRTGRHDCWDRMVVDLNGGAKLQVVIRAATFDLNGHTTYPGVTGQPLPGVDLTGYRTFRDTKFAGSFEGITTVGLGVRARLPFRVVKLDNRVVLDVAHFW